MNAYYNENDCDWTAIREADRPRRDARSQAQASSRGVPLRVWNRACLSADVATSRTGCRLRAVCPSRATNLSTPARGGAPLSGDSRNLQGQREAKRTRLRSSRVRSARADGCAVSVLRSQWTERIGSDRQPHWLRGWKRRALLRDVQLRETGNVGSAIPRVGREGL